MLGRSFTSDPCDIIRELMRVFGEGSQETALARKGSELSSEALFLNLAQIYAAARNRNARKSVEDIQLEFCRITGISSIPDSWETVANSFKYRRLQHVRNQEQEVA